MRNPSKSRQRGMSLVEMMVAITIGMIIVAAMAILFANNSRVRGETDKAAQKIENGRYALEMVSADLQHAGYFSNFDPRTIWNSGSTPTPSTLPDPCTTAAASNLATLKVGLPLHVQGVDSYSSGLGCLSGVKSGTDVLFIRRVSTCAIGSTGCPTVGTDAPIFQASNCTSQLGSNIDDHYRLEQADSTNLDRMTRTCVSGTLAPKYALVHRFYFVASNDKSSDGVPTLKRADICAPADTGCSGGFKITSLVQGVENMQVEYGIDTNSDGNPDIYTPSPMAYYGCPSPTAESTCITHWSNVVSVKVHLLVRNPETSGDFTDAKTYTLGQKVTAMSTHAAETTTPGGSYKRSVFTETVRLQNPSTRKFNPS